MTKCHTIGQKSHKSRPDSERKGRETGVRERRADFKFTLQMGSFRQGRAAGGLDMHSQLSHRLGSGLWCALKQPQLLAFLGFHRLGCQSEVECWPNIRSSILRTEKEVQWDPEMFAN